MSEYSESQLNSYEDSELNSFKDVASWGSFPFTMPEAFMIKKQVSHPDRIHLEDAMFESGARVLFSCPEAWELFFQKHVEIVGIDCEGTTSKQEGLNKEFPLMIQVASFDFVIIEFPSDNKDINGMPCLSEFLMKLIDDKNVLKIFFDPSETDCEMLCRDCNPKIDLSSIIESLNICSFNQINSFGLIDIVSLATGKQYEKNSIKKKGWYSLKSASSMRQNKPFVNYAAADAWGTLFAYQHLIRFDKQSFNISSFSKSKFDSNENEKIKQPVNMKGNGKREDKEQFKCEVCDRYFNTSSQLRSHTTFSETHRERLTIVDSVREAEAEQEIG